METGMRGKVQEGGGKEMQGDGKGEKGKEG